MILTETIAGEEKVVWERSYTEEENLLVVGKRIRNVVTVKCMHKSTKVMQLEVRLVGDRQRFR